LVDDQQHRSVGLHPAVQLAELGLVVGQRPVEQFPAGAVLRDRVVSFLADVQTEEHGDLVIPLEHEYLPAVLGHRNRLTYRTNGRRASASTLRSAWP